MKMKLPLAFAFLSIFAFGFAFADEGMWTLDNPPTTQVKDKYGFLITPNWLREVQLSVAKLPSGSSAFVSKDGLLITNHHVARGIIQKLSSKENDYIKNGFLAPDMAGELKCQDTEVNILVSIQDVTDRVMSAVKKGSSAQEQDKQMSAEISRIEKEYSEKTGLRSDVVKLYQGGLYHLYQYKKYTDVRLVMAPEMQAAHFGGDYDNYTYPRYSLDFSFLRVYDNGKPLNTPHYMKWSKNGAVEDELTFVVGTPGTTSRLQTVAQLEYERDYHLKHRAKSLHYFSDALLAYMAKGPEQKRQAGIMYSGVQNYIKRFEGGIIGLSDKEVMARKSADEKELIAKVKKDSSLKFAAKSWKLIAKALDKNKEIAKRERFTLHNYGSTASVSNLAFIAETIVEYVEQIAKPNEERVARYRDSSLDSLNLKLFSTAPIYKEMEEHLFTAYLQMAKDELGDKDPFVKTALDGKMPAEVAKLVIGGTNLINVDYRKQLIAGGEKAVEKCADPLIVWARKVAPLRKELKKLVKDNTESVINVESNKIARARFAIYGKSIPPDATSTLRLNYGIVKGYESGTTLVPPMTSFYGFYGRALEFNYKEPFDLPAMFVKNKSKVNLETPYNFVTTHDTVGGNSGSPIFNKNIEFVGILFDGNIESLIWPYAYTDYKARSISVHSSAILESLKNVYNAHWIVKELMEQKQ